MESVCPWFGRSLKTKEQRKNNRRKKEERKKTSGNRVPCVHGLEGACWKEKPEAAGAAGGAGVEAKGLGALNTDGGGRACLTTD